MTHHPDVLVVDDDPALRDIMGAACAALGHPAALAADGAGALDLLARIVTIRLALVDVVLGAGATGFALAADIRTLHPDVEVVLLSGLGGSIDAASGGDALILAKPLPLDKLRAVLDGKHRGG
ncbi:hypothetical protein AL036_01325 [Salipiger aestuarii]|uniref:response regulator n=1 Tax=Salipiger aestuarii TaxID=568098 RepID=UPI00123A43F1|nr:response regulator [Salipiger aestuarii]KAA8610138.1 hypothetical protein AL036_01325 [Salipiger aestuarii]